MIRIIVKSAYLGKWGMGEWGWNVHHGPSSPGRGMMPGGGVDLAIADQGYDTFKLLEQLNIPYDEPTWMP